MLFIAVLCYYILNRMKQMIPVFWGCTFTHNYPFLVKSITRTLEILGTEPAEVPGFGCCPDPVYVKAYGRDYQLALSARNLALAEQHGKKLLVACNGCYNILHGAREELIDKKIRDETNALLPEGMKYNGTVEVAHVISLLHSKIPLIKTLVKRPLGGLNVAVHYGCHMLYPPVVPSDDPKDPCSLDDLVNACGAHAVDYESRTDCCGVPVSAFDAEEADGILAKKLSDMQKAKADCIVTSCPACFMRFDMLPAELKDMGIPVLHISELLCLSFGVPVEELFLEGHATKTGELANKIAACTDSEKAIIAKNFSLEELGSHCEACREECSAAVSTRNTDKPFDPLAPVDMLLSGRYYDAVKSSEIWRCLQCGKCEENCPNNCGLKEFYTKLRELSIKESSAPRVIDDHMKMLEETGYSMPKRAGIRKKMGLAPAPDVDSGEIRKILDRVRNKRK
jgi:heterodisulfide reductase subunit B/heterodisulfide reductase subunit C